MTRLVVVGGNAAGMSGASKAKRRKPDMEVIVLEAGPQVSYSTCGIPHLIGHDLESPDELLVLTPEKAAERGIEVRTDTRAVAVNPYTKRVVFEGPGGRDDIGYDRLLLATGAEPLNPFPGRDLDGVFTLRHVNDGYRVWHHLQEHKVEQAAVVGGGPVGLEMAEALRRAGLGVDLYQSGPRLLADLDPEMTDGLDAMLGAAGIEVHLRTPVESLGGDGGKVGSVKAGGRSRDAQLAIVAVGVKPSTEFAVKAGLEATKDGYLIVDDQMKTNYHDIYAAGDCVATRHLVLGQPVPVPLALPSNRMGRVAGDNAAGGSSYFPGVVGTFITRCFGIALAKTGLTEGQAKTAGFDTVSHLIESRDRAGYMPDASDLAVKLVADADSGRLLGGQVVAPEMGGLRINAIAVALKAQMKVRQLEEVETAYAPPFSPVYDPLIVCAHELAKKLRK